MQRQMNRARCGRAVGCHSARFLLPFFGVTGRDSSSTGRDPSSHRTEHVDTLSQGVGARRSLFSSALRRLFPSVRISVRAVALCASCEPASRAKPSMRCEARLLNFFTTKPRATRSFGIRYARRPRRTHEGRGRGERYAGTIVSALHVS